METIEVRPVGMVHNEIADRAKTRGWEEVISEIVLHRDLAGILDGLEGFSHVLVIYWMHKARPFSGLRGRPRGRPDMPELGLLALRTPHRPNPIGLTAAEVVEVFTEKLTVRALDAINGTPILDIKPYIPRRDRQDDAKVPEWVECL
jgi:tRNA-Thr(GGU) m(6)t(6)A37 methyltransferase TsaA